MEYGVGWVAQSEAQKSSGFNSLCKYPEKMQQ